MLMQVPKGSDGSYDASPLQHAARQYLANHQDLLFAPRSAYQEMLSSTSLASMPYDQRQVWVFLGKRTDAKETLSTEVNFSFCCTFSVSALPVSLCPPKQSH